MVSGHPGPILISEVTTEVAMERICERCGKPFQAVASRVKRGQARYCSMQCRRGLNDIRVEGDVAYVYLTDRHDNVKAVAKIDAVDVPKLKEFGKRWAASWWNKVNQYRVVARIQLEPGKGRQAKTKTISMHRFLMDAPDGMEVDHVNHDTLDNRRSTNLRLVTRPQNMQNLQGAHRDSRTGVRGVHWDAPRQRYHARVHVGQKTIHVGYYRTLEEAQIAVIEARRQHMTHSQD